MKIKRRLIRFWRWYDPDLKGSLAERMLEAEFRNVRDYDAPRKEIYDKLKQEKHEAHP